MSNMSHLTFFYFTGPFTFTTAQSFTSSNSFDVHNHNSGATLVPTPSKLPESTSIQTEKTDQTSTTSPKQFHSTTQSSSYPTTTENSKNDPSHSSSTDRTTLTSRSTTPHVGSNSTVTLSSKNLTCEPKTTYESRYGPKYTSVKHKYYFI